MNHSALTVIDRLPGMTFGQIRKLWSNAVRYLADEENPTMQSAAKKVLKAVEREWSRRTNVGLSPDDYFDWPTTDAPGGTGWLTLYHLQQDGMLSYLGYRVGQTHGVAATNRRIILDRIFLGHLPPVFPSNYVNQWHAPRSSQRLKKMAETIAALTRNAKRRNDVDLSDAIRAWEQDLSYLHDKFYVDHFGFGWPTTDTI